MEEPLARTYRLLSTDPDLLSRVGDRVFVEDYPVEESNPNFRPTFPYIIVSEVVNVPVKRLKGGRGPGNSIQDINVYSEDYQEKIDIRDSVIGLLSQLGHVNEIDPSREPELSAYRDRIEMSFWPPR